MTKIDFDLTIAAQVAEGAARVGGALIRHDFSLPRKVRDKGLNDLVTETDVASETAIVNILHAAFPTHNIMAEEKGAHVSSHSPYTWWIDPLDCTINFVHGVPRVGVSIACVDDQANPLVGVIYDPMAGDLFRGTLGGGATVNNDPIHVSQAARLRDSLVASGFPGDLRTEDNNAPEWSAFVPRSRNMARMGSSAIDTAYVASGRFDVYWEYAGPPLLDRIAGMLLIQEAGGKVTDCDGKPFNFLVSECILATNGLVHDEALDVLKSVREGQQS
jgi:myo-inositol-1(or 4)-monophosphatase